MPKAYAIFTEAITDPEGMKAYALAAREAIHSYGATVLAADPQPHVVEGEWHGNQTVLLEFESPEAARAWYFSPEYQAAAALRHAAATTNAVIITGFERGPG